MKKIILSLASVVICFPLFSQESVSKTFLDDPIHHPMAPVYGLLALIVIVLVLVIAVSITLLRSFNMLLEQTLREKAKVLGVAYAPKPSFWSKLSRQLNDSVPVEQEKDIDMGHSYDGIRELDNHLPPWWKWLFYTTIAWAAVYMLFHVSSSLPLSNEEYQNEVASAEVERKKVLASNPQAIIDPEKLEYNADAEIISRGEKIYVINCVACHRKDGGGNTIGPNLTDNYWLHGGNIKNVFTTVNNGFVEKGMPAWGKTMGPGDVRDVTFFVMSLQGTNPADGKAPQGEMMEQKVIQHADSLKSTAFIHAKK
jgi:cytochrome c oxidase cbb3-type subunit III